ncbi:MAG: phosphoribosyltransferase family protein [Usitatibacter sp.]
MSIFAATGTLQALRKAAALVPGWDEDCLLCSGLAKSALCEACERALPHLVCACVRCAVPIPAAGVCGACQRRGPAFDDALAAFEYRFPLDRMVHRFKYGGDLALGRWLALRLADRASAGTRPDLLVAPPVAASRLRERGFNQAVVIAAHVGRRLRVGHEPAAFAKTRETAPQPGLNRRERLANLRGSFRCELRLRGEHVAIVDDVITTGATTHALARLLKDGGASRVSVWALARAPDPARGP